MMTIPRFHSNSSWLALCGLLGLLAPASGEGDSVVRFANGDRLSGSVESLTTERLVWNSPILEMPTTLRLDQVLDVTLPSEIPEFEAGHEATLTLTNGDTVRGQVASVTDDVIQLDTWFAGRLEFRRLMVKSLEISERPDLLYRGPNGLAEWTQSNEDPAAWTFQSGALRSNAEGSIGREVDLADECSIAFDVSWRGMLKLNVIFFSDDVKNRNPENGYELVFVRNTVHLRKSGNHNWLGQTSDAGELRENEKARIEIRASLKTGMIAFFVDDRIVDVWTDPELAGATFGKGLQFVSQDSSPVRISVIEVATWDGVLDVMPEPRGARRQLNQFRQFGMRGAELAPPEPPKPEEEGRMVLRNGDSLKGEVLSITDGFITVKTEYSEVKLPVARLRNITLKTVDLEEPKRMSGDVRAWFADGSSMVFRLDEVNEDTLVGYSQTFGTSEFKTTAFSRIEFNIYSLDMEEIRSGEAW